MKDCALCGYLPAEAKWNGGEYCRKCLELMVEQLQAQIKIGPYEVVRLAAEAGLC